MFDLFFWNEQWRASSRVFTSRFRCFGLTILLLSAIGASGQTFTTLYTFQGGADGEGPNGVILDSAGNMYGTTVAGGETIFGTVFKLTPAGVKTILYNFQGSTDGSEPYGNLVLDPEGNVYGTTAYGGDMKVECGFGPGGCGVVFKVTPEGHETVLHRFTGGKDGGQPMAGLIRDSAGNLYGTTYAGGLSGCYPFPTCGAVFKIDSSNRETVLYSFTGGTDGDYPQAPVVEDSSGNLYGSTSGESIAATIFKLDSNGTETTLLTFSGTNGSDPVGSLALDSADNVYGATYSGGNLNDCAETTFGCGIVFKLFQDGREPILNVFTGGAGGSNPVAGVVRNKNGILFGTTVLGGAYNEGVVYSVTSSGVEKVLYSFTGGSDGDDPETDLRMDSEGNLYGGSLGGTYGYGTIFKVKP
jgi:uncharacterized repeat protein (TIGR03803 family)